MNELFEKSIFGKVITLFLEKNNYRDKFDSSYLTDRILLLLLSTKMSFNEFQFVFLIKSES